MSVLHAGWRDSWITLNRAVLSMVGGFFLFLVMLALYRGAPISTRLLLAGIGGLAGLLHVLAFRRGRVGLAVNLLANLAFVAFLLLGMFSAIREGEVIGGILLGLAMTFFFVIPPFLLLRPKIQG